MGGGLAGRHVRLKRRSGGAIATHSQERFVANCSDLRNRHCERSEAIHGATRGTNGLLRRFAPRNDGAPFSDTTPHSRGAMRPRFVKSFAQRREGAGNAGCLLHPRSRVQKCAKGRTRVYRYSRSIPAFPAQWFYGLWRALPGDEFLLPPSLANGWFAWPGWALQTSASLTPATGARTTRFCRTQPPDFAKRLRRALAPVVCTLCSLTKQSPPCEHHRAPDAAASTASRPNVRDDGQRPSTGTGWREL